jgi:hypothetical protein
VLVASEAQVNTAGKKSEIEVAPAGEVLSVENDDEETREKSAGKKPSRKTRKP